MIQTRKANLYRRDLTLAVSDTCQGRKQYRENTAGQPSAIVQNCRCCMGTGSLYVPRSGTRKRVWSGDLVHNASTMTQQFRSHAIGAAQCSCTESSLFMYAGAFGSRQRDGLGSAWRGCLIRESTILHAVDLCVSLAPGDAFMMLLPSPNCSAFGNGHSVECLTKAMLGLEKCEALDSSRVRVESSKSYFI